MHASLVALGDGGAVPEAGASTSKRSDTAPARTGCQDARVSLLVLESITPSVHAGHKLQVPELQRRYAGVMARRTDYAHQRKNKQPESGHDVSSLISRAWRQRSFPRLATQQRSKLEDCERGETPSGHLHGHRGHRAAVPGTQTRGISASPEDRTVTRWERRRL